MTLPDVLYRYRPNMTRELEALVANRIYFSAPVNFDDPWDCALLESDAAEAAVRDLRVSCFATSDDDTRFWSHYAASHNGICIGYHTDKLSVDESHFYEVNYSDVHPGFSGDLENGSPEAFEAAALLLATKCEAWGPQKEWRVILQSSDNPCFIEHEQDAIASVTFGLRTPENVRRYLVNCLGFNPSIGFREIRKTNGIMTPVSEIIHPTPDKSAYVNVTSSTVQYPPPPVWE